MNEDKYWFGVMMAARDDVVDAIGDDKYRRIMAKFSDRWIASRSWRELAEAMQRLAVAAAKLPGARPDVLCKVVGDPDVD